MAQADELKIGDYLEINFIRGTQVVLLERFSSASRARKDKDTSRTLFVRRWLDSKGEFGANPVPVREAEVWRANPEDPRVKRAKAYRASSAEQPWK